MIELHYAGVIANWSGKRVPSERLIRIAREKVDTEWTRSKNERDPPNDESPANRQKPSVGLEPTTPSLPSLSSCVRLSRSGWICSDCQLYLAVVR
jgi:hypothetical protein